MRGETKRRQCLLCVDSNFNPLPSCEGRPLTAVKSASCCTISIHSPHARGDAARGLDTRDHQNFNPLPSREGRRDDRKSILDIINFNPLPSCEGRHDLPIPLPRVVVFQSTPLMRGETLRRFSFFEVRRYFNPLPSCEGRPCAARQTRLLMRFQSTPLMRGETRRQNVSPRSAAISIHSPHARGDPSRSARPQRAGNFNPLPSCEGRRSSHRQQTGAAEFQSTPLMRGETYQLQYPACIE